MDEPVEEGALLLVRRVYRLCECGGWDEHFEGYERSVSGFTPNGMTLAGRTNHARGCEHTDHMNGGE